MGLINTIVPLEDLIFESRKWAQEMLEKSPTALRFLKASFNADTDWVYGMQASAHGATSLFYQTEEAWEGRTAFLEKRPPNFSKFRHQPW